MRKFLTVLGSVLTVLALTSAAVAQPVLAGGVGPVEPVQSSASGRSASNGQIVFRRYFDADQTEGALVRHEPGRRRTPPGHPPADRVAGQRAGVVSRRHEGHLRAFKREREHEPDHGRQPRLGRHEHGRAVQREAMRGRDRSLLLTRWPRHRVLPHGLPHPPRIAPEWKLYSAIFMVGLDGSGARQVSSTPLRRRGLLATETTDPTFSPDGRLLAFMRTRHSPEDQGAVFVQPIGSPEHAAPVNTVEAELRGSADVLPRRQAPAVPLPARGRGRPFQPLLRPPGR